MNLTRASKYFIFIHLFYCGVRWFLEALLNFMVIIIILLYFFGNFFIQSGSK
jgi:hypothetical protein